MALSRKWVVLVELGAVSSGVKGDEVFKNDHPTLLLW